MDNVVEVKYPEGVEAVAAGTKAMYYEGTVEVPVVFSAPSDLGSQQISLNIDYQQCDAITCFQPDQILASFEVEVVEDGATAPVAVMNDPKADADDSEQSESDSAELGSGTLGIIITGLFAGLALCLTPCVFPMIPITVFLLLNAIGGEQCRKALAGSDVYNWHRTHIRRSWRCYGRCWRCDR